MKISIFLFLTSVHFCLWASASHDITFGTITRRVLYRDFYFISVKKHSNVSRDYDIKVNEPIHGIKFVQKLNTDANIILKQGALNNGEVKIKIESRIADREVSILVDVYGKAASTAVAAKLPDMLILWSLITYFSLKLI